MPISQQQRQFITQKNPAQEYDTITFNHTEFKAPVRLLLNQHKPIVLGGHEFIPVAAKISLPNQGADLTPKLSIQFSRIYVGDEFKKIINEITSFGWQSPISMVYEQYNECSINIPTQRYSLVVTEDGIRFNRTSVQVTASDDNPMILGIPHKDNINPIYTIEEYRGLSSA